MRLSEHRRYGRGALVITVLLAAGALAVQLHAGRRSCGCMHPVVEVLLVVATIGLITGAGLCVAARVEERRHRSEWQREDLENEREDAKTREFVANLLQAPSKTHTEANKPLQPTP